MGVNSAFINKHTANVAATDTDIATNDLLNFGTVADLNEALVQLARGDSLVIDNLSDEIYHESNGYSCSSLKLFSQSPSQLHWSQSCPKQEESENAEFGKAAHCAILEPRRYEDQYVVMPHFNLRKNADKDARELFLLKAADNNKSVISSDDAKKIEMMSESITHHPASRFLLSGVAERSIFYRDIETGLLIKCRPDWIYIKNNHHLIIDLKTIADASRFERQVIDLKYYLQDAFYSHIYEVATGHAAGFAFLAVDKNAKMGRYPVRLVQLSAELKDAGARLFRALLDDIAECEKTGRWSMFETVEAPRWFGE